MPSLTSMLKKRGDEIQDVLPLPPGDYIVRAMREPTVKDSNSGESDVYAYLFEIVEPCEDVDAEELAEAGGVKGRVQPHWISAPKDEEEEVRIQRAAADMRDLLIAFSAFEEEDWTMEMANTNLTNKVGTVTLGQQADFRDATKPPINMISAFVQPS